MLVRTNQPAEGPGAESARRDGEAPARRLSSRLSIVLGGLSGLVRREPDMSLADLRAALLATGYNWSSGGCLALAADRAALLAEFDRLIESCGAGANAADLLL